MIKYLLLLIISSITLQASQLRLTYIHLPVYFHSEEDAKIRQIQVPFVTSYASPEARLGAMNHSYIPHHDKSWNSKKDVNLISVYGFKLSYTQIEGSKDYRLTIDASAAQIPEGYSFSIQQVLDNIKICAPLNFDSYNDSKLLIDVIGIQQK